MEAPAVNHPDRLRRRDPSSGAALDQLDAIRLFTEFISRAEFAPREPESSCEAVSLSPPHPRSSVVGASALPPNGWPVWAERLI